MNLIKVSCLSVVNLFAENIVCCLCWIRLMAILRWQSSSHLRHPKTKHGIIPTHHPSPPSLSPTPSPTPSSPLTPILLPQSQNQEQEKMNPEDELYEFSKRTYLLLLSGVALIVLIFFGFSMIFYGTGCPTMVDAADKITVAYSAKNIYTFTQMNCFGINRWANPATVSETGETEDPTDVFFGLIMLAPGISMFLGLFYVFFFGILWLLAFVGAIQNDHTKINLFRHWSHRALILNIIIMFGNVFSAAFMIIRQGANVYSVNKTWLCASFAKLNWPMCSYVYGFTVYSIIFTILNLIAISMAKGVVREITNENKGEDDDMEVMIE
eukprot:TRINITY_DN10133_c0_g1_i2.p1 TRINITY_DN10133_c0_g1~~TRINITY_DN10133_c0_g1_i2.p1  ORF type:complete len:353 (+),score=100.42 TRINITY_DN10133_c0_g1_i2:85-1059(+)